MAVLIEFLRHCLGDIKYIFTDSDSQECQRLFKGLQSTASVTVLLDIITPPML